MHKKCRIETAISDFSDSIFIKSAFNDYTLSNVNIQNTSLLFLASFELLHVCILYIVCDFQVGLN